MYFTVFENVFTIKISFSNNLKCEKSCYVFHFHFLKKLFINKGTKLLFAEWTVNSLKYYNIATKCKIF